MASSVAILGLLSRQIVLERVGSIYQGHKKHGVQKAEAGGWMGTVYRAVQGCAGLAPHPDLKGIHVFPWPDVVCF